MTIGIFDSGVGGLGIFNEIRKLMPNEQILYLADSANCPYGEKNEQQIKQICLDNSRFLIRKGADIIVVACNTASTVALQYIRDELSANPRHNPLKSASTNIVGVVPVVKTCSEVSKNKKIGILATKATVSSLYLRNLVEKFCSKKDGFKVYYVAANPLVGLIENYKLQIIDYKLNHKSKTTPTGRQVINLKFTSKDLKLIEKYLKLFKENNIDTIALGCTHFPFLLQQIQQIMGDKVRIVDSNGAVARQTKIIVTSNKVTPVVEQSSLRGIASNKVNNNLKYKFYTTGEVSVLKNQIMNLIGLSENNFIIKEKPAEPAC